MKSDLQGHDLPTFGRDGVRNSWDIPDISGRVRPSLRASDGITVSQICQTGLEALFSGLFILVCFHKFVHAALLITFSLF